MAKPEMSRDLMLSEDGERLGCELFGEMRWVPVADVADALLRDARGTRLDWCNARNAAARLLTRVHIVHSPEPPWAYGPPRDGIPLAQRRDGSLTCAAQHRITKWQQNVGQRSTCEPALTAVGEWIHEHRDDWQVSVQASVRLGLVPMEERTPDQRQHCYWLAERRMAVRPPIEEAEVTRSKHF